MLIHILKLNNAQQQQKPKRMIIILKQKNDHLRNKLYSVVIHILQPVYNVQQIIHVNFTTTKTTQKNDH